MNLDRYPDEVDVSQNRLESKTFEVQKLISEFEYRLLGYEWKSNGERMSFTGNPLAGNEVIQKVMIILHAFSKEIILIADVDKFSWARQKKRVADRINALLLKNLDSIADNYLEIFQSYFELLSNLGFILMNNNSKNILRDFWGFNSNNENTDKSKGGQYV